MTMSSPNHGVAEKVESSQKPPIAETGPRPDVESSTNVCAYELSTDKATVYKRNRRLKTRLHPLTIPWGKLLDARSTKYVETDTGEHGRISNLDSFHHRNRKRLV